MKKMLGILSEKKGSVLVFFALSLIVLTAMAGLALDVTHLYGVKSQLQLAADAAALAGAAALDSDPVGSARTVAGRNFADVYPAGSASAGAPMPVSLASGPPDIILGSYTGTTFTQGGSPENAVEVIARRTGASSDQPMVRNWLIKVLSATGLFDETGVEAAAVAVREPAKLLPIVVNEYWQGTNPYPESYMRQTDVDGSTGLAGQTFAVLGSGCNVYAPGSVSPNNYNAFADLSWRCDEYNPGIPSPGSETHWYAASSDGSETCSNFGNMTTMIPCVNNGQVDDEKTANVPYLLTGVPSGMILPNAVYEPYDSGFPIGQTTAFNNYPSSPSNAPYATIPHFSSSGNEDCSSVGNNGQTFCQRWPRGSRFIIMVCDGCTQKGTGKTGCSTPSVTTVVGYGVIEVDGYADGGASGNPVPGLGPSGNTCYGHAVPTGVPGQADPYIVQPTPSNPTPYCQDFLPLIQQMEDNNANVRLVDPGLVVDNAGY